MLTCRREVVHPDGGRGLPVGEEVGGHVALALDLDFATALELVGVGLEHLEDVLRALRLVRHPRRVHPARHVDRVAPDVVLRLARPDNPRHHGPEVHPHPQHEVVVAVLVEAGELLPHGEDVLGQLHDGGEGGGAPVLGVLLDTQLGDEADGGHVRAAHRLDLVHGTEPLVSEKLVKVNNYFIEKPGNADDVNASAGAEPLNCIIT